MFQSVEQSRDDSVRLIGATSGPWKRAGWTATPLQRTIGNEKPFLKELFDLALADADDQDWLLYTNTDCSVVPTMYSELRSLRATVVEYQRTDVEGEPQSLEELYLKRGEPYSPGIDGIALRAGFYREYCELLPDFIIGEPWWDLGYSWITRELVPVLRLSGRLRHPKHQQMWSSTNPNTEASHNHELILEGARAGYVSELVLHPGNDRPDTAIVTPLFGNCSLRLKAAIRGLERQSWQDLRAEHYVVELLDDEQPSRLPAELLARFRHIRVTQRAEHLDLFQKEALSNIGWRTALREGAYDYFIFTDSDIYSEDASWFRKIRRKLRDNPAQLVHGYNTVVDSVDPTFSFCSLGSVYASPGVTNLPVNPGLCWGFHRKMLEAGDGLNPYCIECAGDSALVTEYLNHSGQIYDGSLSNWPWYAEIQRELPLRAELTAVDCDLVHCYHGPAIERNYNEVRTALSMMRPLKSLVGLDQSGLLFWRKPSCPEREVLRRRSELRDEYAVRRCLSDLGIVVEERREKPKAASSRPVPSWSSETPAFLRSRHNPFDREQSSFSIFNPMKLNGPSLRASWCDKVETIGNTSHLPIIEVEGQPRLQFKPLVGSEYVIGVLPLLPTWANVNLKSWDHLRFSVLAEPPDAKVFVSFYSLDRHESEVESKAIDVKRFGHGPGKNAKHVIPLEEFVGPEGFDFQRVRSLKIVGHGNVYLELSQVYLDRGEFGLVTERIAVGPPRTPFEVEHLPGQFCSQLGAPAELFRTIEKPSPKTSHTVSFDIGEGPRRGETWLLSCWIRGGENEPRKAVHQLGSGSNPRAELLHKTFVTEAGWHQFLLPLEFEQDFEPGALSYRITMLEPQCLWLGKLQLWRVAPGQETCRIPATRP